MNTADIKKLVLANKGEAPKEAASFTQVREAILKDLQTTVQSLDNMRTATKDRRPVDISLGQYVQEMYGFSCADNGSPESFYAALGIDAAKTTVHTLSSMPEFQENYKWLVPEVVREAVRLGLRKPPIYSNLIAAEESITTPTTVMPSINMSDAMPRKIGEAETISTGALSFGEKTVKAQKVGIGLEITDEVEQYVSLNVLSVFLQDVGVKINLAQDSLAIDTLINGDQASGVNAASVIGVNTVGTFTYYDLLRTWIRMGMLGRLPQSILSNENPALEILMLQEFRDAKFLQSPQGLNLRTPVPASTNYDIHGAMPVDDQIMLIDRTAALIKLNASALRIESERTAKRGINGTYVTLTTGFANLYNDARLIIDKSVAFTQFPSFMDYQVETFK